MSLLPPLPAPLGLLAELTHRCPLACPYCSNPLDLERRSGELDTATWLRLFEEAAALGVLQLHLSGGEPAARSDLAALVRGASRAGLYTNLITSGIGLDSINAVIHRANIDVVEEFVREAAALGARRIEVAHSQYYGWALKNRAALLPSAEQVAETRATVERLRVELQGTIVIDYVAPDYFGRFPKPCMNGWGRQSLNVTPSGRVLPCHAAETIPGLGFWSVRERPLREIWQESPAFNAFRGTGWMREPCASCPRREVDFGGCRCQALALTGDPRNADPVCMHSPARALITAALEEARRSHEQFAYRRYVPATTKAANPLTAAAEG
ncbi:MAG TPA: radical SAM protein [Beijerinckiaceae bacterium]|nr:radical SAM protein [Beijerinckiaceae bacterium]